MKPQDRFIEACTEMNVAEVKRLIGYVEYQDPFYETGLLAACRVYHPETLEIVRLLLENGANPDVSNDDGVNPIDLTLRYPCFVPKLTRLLLDYSEQGVNRVDVYGCTYMSMCETEEAKKFLIEEGYNLD
jgi:ankyrin repeat protein